MSNLARIQYMDSLIKKSYKKCFTVKEVADFFEVSERTVKADIEFIGISFAQS